MSDVITINVAETPQVLQVDVLTTPQQINVTVASAERGLPGANGDKGDPASSPLVWAILIFWPSIASGTTSIAGVAGNVRAHTQGASTFYRFIPSTSSPMLDGFYSTFSGGVLSDLICTRG